MAYDEQQVVAVRGSYVYERLNLTAAADKHDVNYQTARRWKAKAKKEGDDWDKARAASRLSSGGLGDITEKLIEDFGFLFQTTIEEVKKSDSDPIKKAEAMSRLADAYTKTMKAASSGNPKIAELAIALKVLEEFAKFIREKSPADIERFAALLEPFGKRVSEVFG